MPTRVARSAGPAPATPPAGTAAVLRELGVLPADADQRAGRSDAHEHMVAVSEVDAHGRAWAVTNPAVPDEPSNPAAGTHFEVRRVMLYDPAQPGVGQLYEWAAGARRAQLGGTGNGGFELYRPRPG